MIVIGALALLLVYGTAVEPRLILDTEEEVAAIPNLPPEWEGRTLAATADFQVGMWWANRGMMDRVVRDLVRKRPAAVLLAGDFIYHPDEYPDELVREVAEMLRPLAESGIPPYAVLGNHDWGLDVKDDTVNPTAARLVRQGLAELGIPVLQNQAVRLGSGDGAPCIVGIGDAYAENDRPRKALAEVPDGAAPLAVAAHTHGGQVRIPAPPEITYFTLRRAPR